MNLLIKLSIASLVILTGCQSISTAKESTVTFSGETHTDKLLRTDTQNMVAIIIRADGCNIMNHIDSAVTFFEPGNGIEGHVWGEETWTVMACDKLYPFSISFTEDGVGGTYFGIQQK